MSEFWFEDLSGRQVESKSLPVAKIYVVDPERLLEVDWILSVTTPFSWEQIVRTNCDRLEVLADHCGCFDSRGDARKSGFFGTPFFGLELYGVVLRHFWVWLPENRGKPGLSPKRLWTARWFSFLDDMGW